MKKALNALIGVGFWALAACAAPASAQNIYNAPNTSNPTSVNFGGVTYVNHGLVGAGRFTSSALDFHGQTLGSFSGMAPARGEWRRTETGYAGRMFTLPDRGYNTDTIFSDYVARLEAWDFTFTPYAGATDLPQSPASQNQMAMTPNASASFLLHDFNRALTTGFNPGAHVLTQRGFTLPGPPQGQPGGGRISLDAEALTFRADNSFYIGDEYAAGLYYFTAMGEMAGYIAPPAAIAPRDAAGNLNFGADLSTIGRRTNQGFEGISIAPSGRRLFAVLQSAPLQDSTNQQDTRLNTRVLVYDIARSPTPSAPVGHYVLQLPIFDRDGTGGAPDRTAAQSEILALSDTRFLLLTRDGSGIGADDGRPLMFKSVYIVDISGATNLAGGRYETSTTPVAPGGVLRREITPVRRVELVNIVNPAQLRRVGLSSNVVTAHPQTPTNLVSEKWESMMLLPALDPSAPDDYFLFIGNDNDFGATDLVMPVDADGPDAGDEGDNRRISAGVVVDNMVLVYRLTLPGYSAAAR